LFSNMILKIIKFFFYIDLYDEKQLQHCLKYSNFLYFY